MRLPLKIATVSALACSAAIAARAQESDVIRVDVQVVNVLATVRDKDNHLVTTLTKDDFVLKEDGVEQEIRYFAAQTDLPLTVGLLVDTSVSQQRVLDTERAAGYTFFNKTLREKKDLAFLLSFDVDVELLQDLTGSAKLLRQGLESLAVQGSTGGLTPGPIPTSGKTPGTVLYDSVYLAASEMLRPQVGRKAVVLISDGNDWGSKLSIDEAIAAAHKSDVVIYSVRYFDREFYYRSGASGGGGWGMLKRLARETGGGAFEVTRKRPLEAILDEINAEIRSQYSIGYSPKRDLSARGFRKIELDVKRKGMKAQAREGYYPEAVLGSSQP